MFLGCLKEFENFFAKHGSDFSDKMWVQGINQCGLSVMSTCILYIDSDKNMEANLLNMGYNECRDSFYTAPDIYKSLIDNHAVHHQIYR